MSKKTVRNDSYKGLVENMAIPAEVCERDGKKYATFGSVVPIHSCTQEEVSLHSATTHHYCDIFTDEVLAPVEELAYCRLDDSTAEKVFINRTKRLLITSSDGCLAQWRSAPTFESANSYLAGTPLVTREGRLISVLTAKKGNHYAVSSFEGDGGYFDTPLPWKIIESKEGSFVYGDKLFPDRESLRAYVRSLGPASGPNTPVLVTGTSPRVALVSESGRQIAHYYLHGVISTGIEYL